MDIKKILSGIAPTVATVLGGPLAGLAVDAIGKAMGMDTPTVESVTRAIQDGRMTGEQIEAIRMAEVNLQARLKELDIDLEKVAGDDRASARSREMAVRDYTPQVLAYLLTVGFFGVLGYLLEFGKPAQGGDALLVMLGSLGGAWGSMVAYYYGSSSGSRQKTEELAKLATR